MSCTKHFLNLQWEQHRWRKRVTAAEIMTAEETDLWARPVFRDYVRCDKEEYCEVCGKIRNAVSCVCDRERGEACKLRHEWVDLPGQVSAR